MKLGIQKVANAEYHKGEGLGSSDLKQLLRSPAHYVAYKQNPIDPSPQMILGSLVHTLILEPELFEKEYAVGDHKQRRGKEYEKAVADNVGKTIVTREQFEEANLIVEEVKNQIQLNDKLKPLLEGINETAFYWEDAATGILCKAKPDIITPDGIVVDLKTSSDASFDAFQKQMVDLKYFLSVAYYMRGYVAATQKSINPFRAVFVVIETKAPYAIATYELDETALRIGNEMIDRALEVYAEAVSTETWGSYPKELVRMGIPNWATYKWSKPNE